MAAMIAVLLSGLLVPQRGAVVQAASVPTGLPSHFGIGVSAAPDNSGIYGWMPNTGIAWDYAYQYLSGGVNTTGGWSTWNASGQFPLYYAQGAASHNYVPVLTYYNLLQSNGTCGSCAEAQKDLSNLNNTSTMSSYFADFRLLMLRLGSGTYGGIAGFSKTAIVHVEPDLSGYAEQAVLNNSGSCSGYCTAQGNNPAFLKAAVAASGDINVQAYPNTYQGFNWALLHLRDLYAPNVRLAFHVSDWATSSDISTNTSTTLNATTLGQEVGSFAAQSGTSSVPSGTTPYDLLFNDVSDRDAGYYKYVYNNPNAYWDRLNVSFPNFHRWESYVSAASGAAGRSVIVWQIPEGNQYFATENNTNGHYQDNRAEYFFSHISELANSGIIGLLFGAGNGGSTVHTDGMNDGVTNPASTCTSDGVSSGQVCNNHVSTVSDDDGGYIRMQAQQYFAGGGYPLSGGASPTPTPTAAAGSPTTTPVPPTSTATSAPTATAPAAGVAINSASASPSTVVPGATTTLSTTVTSNTALAGAIVDFEVYDSAGTKIYQTYQSPVSFAANTAQTFTANWSVPGTQVPGTYTLKIGVFGSGWTPMYAWNDAGATMTVSSSAATSTPTATSTSMPTSTNTPTPTATGTPTPTLTSIPTPTFTGTPTPTLTTTPTPKPISTSTPTVTLTVTATSRLGLTTAGTSVDKADSNAIHGSRIVTGSQSETVQSISVDVGAVGSAPYSQYSVAVYTDVNGMPGSLVALSSAGTLKAKTWNTLPLAATLAPNAAYWLVYNTNGNTNSVNNLYYNSSSTNGSARSGSTQSFGSWPSNFGSATRQTRQYSIYATVNP
jgi:hypothetical protein